MSFPGYERYRESGVGWLGDMPAHWSLMTLKRDVAFLTSGSRGWADHYADDGALFIRIGNLTREHIDLDLTDIQRVAVPDGSEGERTRVESGDVLFSITAYLGSVAVVPENLETAYVSQHVALTRLRRERLLPSWVGYVTLSVIGKTYLAMRGYGGTKVQLSLDDIAELIMTVPPVVEQEAITAFLDDEVGKIDALVEEQRRFIELLKEKRQAVISHAVTKGLDPTAPMKDSCVEWLGAVPAHWEVVPLRWLFRFVKRQEGAEFEVLSVYREFGVIEKSSREDNNNKTPEDLSKYQTVQIGDLVINKMKAWQGSAGVSIFDGITSPDYAVFEPTHAGCDHYFNWLLRCRLLPAVYLSISNGIRNDQWRLEPDKLREVRLPLPPVLEQESIAQTLLQSVGSFDALIAEADILIGLLQERRAALISAAVTGKIDVRTLAPTLEDIAKVGALSG